MSQMTARELRDSGLLWHINQSVLWPLGLALAIDIDMDDDADPGKLHAILKMDEPIWSGATPDEMVAQAERLGKFMQARMAELKT